MTYFKELNITETEHPSVGTEKEVELFCGKHRVGIVSKYSHLDEISASTVFNNKYREVQTMQEGIDFIKEELNTFIYDILRQNI